MNKILGMSLVVLLAGCGSSDSNEETKEESKINTYKLTASFINKTPVEVSSNKSDSTFGVNSDSTVSKKSVTTYSQAEENIVDSFLSADGTLTAALNDFVIDSSLVSDGEIVFTIRNIEPTDPSYLEPTESELNDPNATIPSSFDNYTMTNKCLVFKGNLTTNVISCLSPNFQPFSGKLSGLKTSKGWIVAGTQIEWGDTIINEQGWYGYTSKDNYGLHLIEETGPKHILWTEFKPKVIVANETQDTDSLAVSSPYEFLKGVTKVVQNIGEDTQTVNEIPYSATAIQYSGNGLYMQLKNSGFVVAVLDGQNVQSIKSGSIAKYDQYSSKLYKLHNPKNRLEGNKCLHLHEMSPFSPNRLGVGVDLGKDCQNKSKISNIYNGKAIFIQKSGDSYLVNKLDTLNQTSDLLCELDSDKYDTQGIVYNGTAIGYQFKQSDESVVYCGFDWIDNSLVTKFQHSETIEIKDNGVSTPAVHKSDKTITLDAGAIKGQEQSYVVVVVSSSYELDTQSIENAIRVASFDDIKQNPTMSIVDGQTVSFFYPIDYPLWRAENVGISLDQTLLQYKDGSQFEFEGEAITVFHDIYNKPEPVDGI